MSFLENNGTGLTISVITILSCNINTKRKERAGHEYLS